MAPLWPANPNPNPGGLLTLILTLTRCHSLQPAIAPHQVLSDLRAVRLQAPRQDLLDLVRVRGRGRGRGRVRVRVRVRVRGRGRVRVSLARISSTWVGWGYGWS